MKPAEILEWQAELRRRLARAKVLLNLGLPDPGFKLLAKEIHLLSQASRDLADSRRAA